LELSTLYDRLGEPVKSQLALDRALRQSAETKIKAETEARIARNSKTVWIREWSTEEHLQNRQRRALESPYLEESAKRYEKGFLRNLNQFYPGINALGLYRVQYELAIRHADSWASKFEDASDAEPVLRKLGQKLETIAHAVRQSLVAAQGLEEGDPDVWRIITDADLFLLTSDNVNFVKTKYREAKATCAQINNDDRFAANAAARQLQLYIKLGVLEENAKAGLEAIGAPSEKEESPQYDRVLVFVGHQIDAPGRAPRFPAACEEKARQGIRARVAHYLESANGGRLVGFAGAASGGDILFHEVCVELGVETRMLVGVPERVHIREALSPANGDWLDRYRRLAQKVKPRFLSESDELPTWLEERTSRYTPLLRTSLWFIKTANSVPAVQYTLLALWDGEKGTGTGGTGDMVELAERNGFAKDIIDTAQVFGQSLSLPA
jgi:hypothetical protein